MLLRPFAHEERGERPSAHMAEGRSRGGERHRTHFQPADALDVQTVQLVEDELREPRRAGRMQHRRLHVEIEIALAPGGELDLAAPERTLADQRHQLRADLGRTVWRVAQRGGLTAKRLHGGLGTGLALHIARQPRARYATREKS